jgi:hypothetical protein
LRLQNSHVDALCGVLGSTCCGPLKCIFHLESCDTVSFTWPFACRSRMLDAVLSISFSLQVSPGADTPFLDGALCCLFAVPCSCPSGFLLVWLLAFGSVSSLSRLADYCVCSPRPCRLRRLLFAVSFHQKVIRLRPYNILFSGKI